MQHVVFQASAPRAALRTSLVALMLVACDVPTSAPILEQNWVLPAEGATLSVDRFLPDGVSVQGGAFALALPSASLSQSIGELCGPCGSGTFTLPKPAFQTDLVARVALPTDLVAATLVGGSVLVEIENGLGFDPLRPSASGARGRIVTTISSGATLVAVDTVSGDGVSLRPGTTVARAITVAAVTIDAPLDVRVSIHSPAGDQTTVNGAQRLSVRTTPQGWRVAHARVALRDRSVRVSDLALDLSGMDGALVDRVMGGAMRLVVSNPLALVGPFSVIVSAPGEAPITKPLTLQASASPTAYRLPFTAAELRSILGRSGVRLAVQGTMSGGGPGQTVELSPGASITITNTLELTLRSEVQ